MLVFTRKKGERIVIERAIRIEVVEIKGNRVRLGITAPASIDVHREEVWQEIETERIRRAS